jgi:hypothetical protein
MGEILTSASDEAIQTTEPVWCIMCDNMPWKQSVTCSKESSAQQRVTRRGSDASGCCDQDSVRAVGALWLLDTNTVTA